MYIQPNTTIKLLTECPLDNTYDHTINFASASAQSSYFAGLAKYTFTDQTYQRVNKSTLRVQVVADNIYDCNYLMFQNSAYGSKWFYAFITQVEYINNIVSEITYEIDVMQTWYFDYTLKSCFVEREHSNTDVIGDNLVPENLEQGDYVISGLEQSGALTPTSIVVSATARDNGGTIEDVSGAWYGNRFSGTWYSVFNNTTTGAQNCIEFLEALTSVGKADGVVNVFTMPTQLIVNNGDSVNTLSKNYSKSYSDIDGYTPKNNKLFTYPYNFLYVTNYQGNGGSYPFEYFQSSSCTFNIAGDMSDGCTAVLLPLYYKNSQLANYDEKMMLQCANICSYNIDTFKNWIAQNGVMFGVNTVTQGLNSLTTVNTATNGLKMGAALSGGIDGVNANLAQVYQKAILPNQARGSNSGATMQAIGALDFGFMTKCIRAEFAQIIDEYFSMFGYQTNRVKVPNTSGRPYWNYVKLGTVVLTGSVPADDTKKLQSIYLNGVTFWGSGSNVGDYSLDNSII